MAELRVSYSCPLCKEMALHSAAGIGGGAAPQPLTFKSGKLSTTDELVAEFICIQPRSSASGFWAARRCPLLTGNIKRCRFLAVSFLGELSRRERRPSLDANKQQTGAH